MTSARDSSRLSDLLRREQSAMADFLVALADFDRKRLWVDLGHASLFSFLHRELGLSAGAAHYRKTAAGLVQRFPEIVEPLRDGRLCITSIVELAKVLTPENRAEVLPRFFHRSKREAKAVSAEICPAEAVPRRDTVTAVPSAAAARQAMAARRDDDVAQTVTPGPAGPSFQPDETPAAASTGSGSPRPTFQPVETRAPTAASAPAASRTTAEPLTADLRRLHVTVSRRFLDKLEAARAALSHSHPGASAENILEVGLDLAAQAKRKALVEKPRKARPSANPDHVPANVKRTVWLRDGGRCQWRLDSGGICGSTLRVELDHVVPRARGGPSTVENTRLGIMQGP